MTATPLYPLQFEPYLRPMPWGGKRLQAWLTADFPEAPIGEGWLLSDHTMHASRVAAGPLAGCTLRQLMEERATELLGRPAERFPLLIKLLDARENLSIQVHPDDERARRWAPREGGKTESWYILESDPEGAIYLDLKPGVDRTLLEREISGGTAPLCLARHAPRPGECYHVPAGTVHALGGGLVVLEVQQTSDATFRLFDWGRVDAQGRPRALHLEAGLACTVPHPAGAGLQRPVSLGPGVQQLVECAYFAMRRVQTADMVKVSGPAIVVVLGGSGHVETGFGTQLLARGQLLLVPACVREAAILPRASMEWIQVEVR